MTVAKVSEISSESAGSFEDASRQGIDRADRSVDHVRGTWMKEQKVHVEDGRIVACRVDMMVTFMLGH